MDLAALQIAFERYRSSTVREPLSPPRFYLQKAGILRTDCRSIVAVKRMKYMLTARQICIVGAALGGLGVLLGAFGTHSLRDVLDESAMSTYGTGIDYLQVHAIYLLILGISALQMDIPRIRTAATIGLAGILVFSGSVITLALTGISWLGAIAPVGGLLLITSWGWTVLAFMRHRS